MCSVPKVEPPKKDFSTAILDRKKAPNRLVVDDAINDDNSVATLHPNTMDVLALFRGDTLLLKVRSLSVDRCLVLRVHSHPVCCA